MSYKVLNDAVGLIRDETPMWEGSYQELPDKTKDGLIALWLITHPTWMDDVFPHTVSDKPLLALEAIYSEDATSRMAAAMFRMLLTGTLKMLIMMPTCRRLWTILRTYWIRQIFLKKLGISYICILSQAWKSL